MSLTHNTLRDVLNNKNVNDLFCIIQTCKTFAQPDVIVCHPSLLLNDKQSKTEIKTVKQQLRSLYLTKTSDHMKYVHIPNVNLYPCQTLNSNNNENALHKRWSIVSLDHSTTNTTTIPFKIIGQFEIFRGDMKKIPVTPYEPRSSTDNGRYSNEMMFSLFIHQSVSRKGIGSAILAHLRTFGMDELNLTKVSCLVNQDNQAMNNMMTNVVPYHTMPPFKAFKRIKQKFNYYYT
jgi:hypothetical protein